MWWRKVFQHTSGLILIGLLGKNEQRIEWCSVYDEAIYHP